jgi:bacillithiol synthase
MNCKAHRIPYRQTGAFSAISLDYVDQADTLKPFFSLPFSLKGLEQAMHQREKFNTNRAVLVNVLKKQYEIINTEPAVTKNIERLLSGDTFTITTAHQPNIFTGPLYFIYKILHAIKLAEHLTKTFSGKSFVPVYYIGSEDADLDELGHFHLNKENLVWNTKQTGAVGRMFVDKELLKLLAIAKGQLSVLPFGEEIINVVSDCYTEGETIQTATFKLVNALFGKYGLVVLNADNRELKAQMKNIFVDDLLDQVPSKLVQESVSALEKTHKVQAQPRDINLFYLKDDLRGRIEKINDRYQVHGSDLSFTKEELLLEVDEYPERFSPNVILRGLYQEMILPNIAFIGGGGELAYWLELKSLFNHYQAPYPVLVLRNSFLLVERKWKEKINKLALQTDDFFKPTQELIDQYITEKSDHPLTLNGTLSETEKLYAIIKKQAAAVDASLAGHVENLKKQSLRRLQELEKKMLRSEKRKFADQQRQINTIKDQLFPGNGLQERFDNFMYYYALWGSDFITTLYSHSLTLEHEFVVLEEN